MQLGFVSAILPELSLDEILAFAAGERFQCVEVMCWPHGKAERRYAGVTHVDVASLGRAEADAIREWSGRYGVAVSGLGYYPNPLASDPAESAFYVAHLKKVILAAELLGVGRINTFIGRDPQKSVDDNWARMLEIWRPLVALAEEHDVKIGIENCPMFFTRDEWPAGKNLAYCPAVWRRLFADIPSPNLGLNYDPSHLVWQQMDYLRPIGEFADRLFHVHLKDAQVDRARLNEVGILATPLEYHSPKLPGRGDVDWPRFFASLRAAGYRGPVCIEVEDREFEGSLADRKQALHQTGEFLRGCLEAVF